MYHRTKLDLKTVTFIENVKPMRNRLVQIKKKPFFGLLALFLIILILKYTKQYIFFFFLIPAY